MTDEIETRSEPVESLDSIEMTYVGEETIEVSGYDEDGNFWKEYYKHHKSELVDEAEE